MRLDLTDLRLFLNVAEAGSITAGADASHMTLASASERIRGMEIRLGSPLLVRERRGVRLTPSGHTLVHHARLVLRQMALLQGDLGDYASGVRGHVRLLCNTSALSEYLPEVLSRFLADHPGVTIDLEERTSDQIVDAVRNGECDVGVSSDAVDLEGLQVFPFRSDPLVLVLPRGHVLASRKSIRLADVAGAAFVGLATDSALQELLTRHARRLGKRLNYRVRLRSFESVCRMVGLGVGVGIVPQAVAVRCARICKVQRVALSDPWAARGLVVCVREMEALPGHVRQLAAHLLATSANPATPSSRAVPPAGSRAHRDTRGS